MITKIGDVCSFINGDRSKNYPSSTEFIESGIPFINAGHIENQRISFDNMNYISEKKYNSLKSGKVKIGDVLFCLRGSLGKNAVIDFENDAAIASSLVIIRPNQSLIKSEYISIYFNSLLFKNKLMKLNNGSSQPNLSAASIKSIEISVPDMKKQNEIINKLLVTKELIDKQMEELELLNELVRARFVEMFGNPENNPYNFSKMKLGKICDVRDGTHDSPKYQTVGYPLITSKNLTSGEIDFSNCNYIKEEDYKKINLRSEVTRGDIIMPMIGTIGNPIIVNTDIRFAIKNVALIKFNNNKLQNIYVKYFLGSDYFDFSVLRNIRGGTQKFIALKDLRDLDILVPPLELQNQFASFVQEIDKSRSRIQKSLEASQELFDSLMQEYFG